MITKEKVAHIAKLAKLKLMDQEADELASELGKIIGHIDELADINTDEVEPTAQVSGLTNRLRADVAVDCDELERQNTLKSAQLSETGLVKVKKIL